MIEDVKKRLSYIKSNNLFDEYYISDMEYLIGEVERLERQFEHSQNNMKMAVSSMEHKNHQVEELQKALEWYANKVNYLPYRMVDLQENVIADQGDRARQALERTKP